MNDKVQDQGQNASARRRLIRGAFAVPAVITLHSGSALAASSAVNCLFKRNQSAVTEPPNLSSDDSIFRYRLWVFKHVADGSYHVDRGLWIVGSGLTPFIRNGQMPFLTSSQWQAFNTTTNQLVGTPQTSAPVPEHTLDADIFVQEGPWISLRVDSTGKLVGAGASGTGSAVSDSCWNSFALASPP